MDLCDARHLVRHWCLYMTRFENQRCEMGGTLRSTNSKPATEGYLLVRGIDRVGELSPVFYGRCSKSQSQWYALSPVSTHKPLILVRGE